MYGSQCVIGIERKFDWLVRVKSWAYLSVIVVHGIAGVPTEKAGVPPGWGCLFESLLVHSGH